MIRAEIVGIVVASLLLAGLAGLFAVAAIRARRRDAERLAGRPLLRYTLTPDQREAFLRRERGLLLGGLTFVAIVTGLVLAAVAWPVVATFAGRIPVATAVGVPATVAAAVWVLVRAYVRARYRGVEVSIHPFGAIVCGVFVDWSRTDVWLRAARVTGSGPDRVLHLGIQDGSGTDESFRAYDVPLPPGIDGAALVASLPVMPADG
jgi:hypothetical protein